MLNIFPYVPTLLIEENRLFRRLLSMNLMLIGFNEVYEAADTSSVHRMLDRRSYSLIIVGVRTGDRSGMELLHHLQADSNSRHALLIATGKNDVRLKCATIQFGADAFLDRPISVDLLERTLTSLFISRVAWKCNIVSFPRNHNDIGASPLK